MNKELHEMDREELLGIASRLLSESARSMNRHRQHLAAQCIHSVVSLYIAGCFDPTHWECEINEGLSRGALELADEIIRQSEQEPTQ